MEPLSTKYTRQDVSDTLRVLAKSLDYNKIQDETIWQIINKNILKIFGLVSGSSLPDYAKKLNVSDAVSNYGGIVIGGVYNYANKRVNKTSHLLSSTDIGKRIILIDSTDTLVAGISTIRRIDDTNNFTINDQLFTDNIDILSYVVLSHHESSYIDVSTLGIDKIIKLVSSIHKNIPAAPSNDFENLAETYRSSAFYYYEGGFIYLFKGERLSTWGTLYLHYNRIPIFPTADTDYIDLKDDNIPLLIDLCSIEIYLLAEKAIPPGLKSGVEDATMRYREADVSKKAELESSKKS